MSVSAEQLVSSPRPLGPPLQLRVGERVVAPAHGVAEVVAIEAREYGGTACECYVLLVPESGIRLSIPAAAANVAGIRPLMTRKEAESVMGALRDRRPAVGAAPWARRARAYRSMLCSGSPQHVARVMGDLARLRSRKELSFGERKMLDMARRMLVKEVALVRGESESSVERRFGRAAGAPVN